MTKITVMLSGLGSMGTLAAETILGDDRFQLVPYALVGADVLGDFYAISAGINTQEFLLVRPDKRGEIIPTIVEHNAPFIVLDFVTPGAGTENAQFYCNHNIPFVMGSTDLDYEAVENMIRSSDISAVVAPNFATPIVVVQTMLADVARRFPGALHGYSLNIIESHQVAKEDTSGTAKAMVKSFNDLGIEFSVEDIEKIRSVERQRAMGVSEQNLGGHGYHTYFLVSPDEHRDVSIRLEHNVNGRSVYAHGACTALAFLHQTIQMGITGKIFSMSDVLESGGM